MLTVEDRGDTCHVAIAKEGASILDEDGFGSAPIIRYRALSATEAQQSLTAWAKRERMSQRDYLVVCIRGYRQDIEKQVEEIRKSLKRISLATDSIRVALQFMPSKGSTDG